MILESKGWFRWHYEIREGETLIGELTCRTMSRSADVVLYEQPFTMKGPGWFGHHFELHDENGIYASATRKGWLVRRFEVYYAAQSYTLRNRGLFGGTWSLSRGGMSIGSITRKGFFGGRVELTVDEETPLSLQAFMAWLAILTWQESAAAASSASVIAGASSAGTS